MKPNVTLPTSCRQLKSLVVALAACVSPVCEAATVSIASGVEGTFSVSGTDLGQASGTSVVLSNGSALYGSSVGRLNDGGIYGGELPVQSNHTLITSASGIVTFNFDLGLNPQGYDISAITVLTASAQNRTGQAYSVSYADVNNPLSYVFLASLSGGEFGNDDGATEVQSYLTDLNAYNVASLQFTFANVGEESMFREIDISGAASAVPEPGSMFALGGLLAGGLTIRQRRLGAKARSK
jgi:hypothetical protein